VLGPPAVERLLESARRLDPARRRDRRRTRDPLCDRVQGFRGRRPPPRDLDLTRGTARASAKGTRERVVPLARALRSALEAYLNRTGRYCRPASGDGSRLRARSGRRFTRRTLADREDERPTAGLPDHVSPHTLRHTSPPTCSPEGPTFASSRDARPRLDRHDPDLHPRRTLAAPRGPRHVPPRGWCSLGQVGRSSGWKMSLSRFWTTVRKFSGSVPSASDADPDAVAERQMRTMFRSWSRAGPRGLRRRAPYGPSGIGWRAVGQRKA